MMHPEIKEITHIDLLDYEKIVLKNGLPVYLINAGSQPLLKIDVLFNAGNVYSTDPVVPAAVNALLNDGTSHHNSSEIADIIDGKGAFYVPDIQKDFSQTSLYLLSRFSSDLLPLYSEMINGSIFPDEEIALYQQNMKQRFKVEHKKVNVQSHQAFINAIFGKDSRYADLVEESSFDSVKRDDLVRFYEQNVKQRTAGIIISGMVDDHSFKEVCKNFENFELEKADDHSAERVVFGDVASTNEWIEIPGKNNQQVSMRIGRPTVAKDHPDYWGLSLLSTILGGYFGSRLNKVIREEKGLTYGIHSHITKLKKANYLSIHAELNASNWKEAYSSVLEVFDDLKTNPVSDMELEMVRKYIKGRLLHSVDGAFSFSNYIRNSIAYGLDDNRINAYLHFLDNTDSAEIMRLAKQYLQENSFYKIVAGV